MQIINIDTTDPSVFYQHLQSVAVPNWFSSVTFEEGSQQNTSIIKCYIDEDLAIEFTGIGSVISVTIHFASTTESHNVYRSQSYSDYFEQIIVTDNAIILTNRQGKVPFIICKNTNNKICICSFTDRTSGYVFSSTNNSESYYTFIVLEPLTNNVKRQFFYMNNDAASRNTYAVPIPTSDNFTIQNVYIVLTRPFSSESMPLQCIINNNAYFAVNYSSLLVKI